MGKILDSFRQNLPASQARKIEKFLVKETQKKAIRTQQEFKDELQKKIRELLESDVAVRALSPPVSPDDRSSSVMMNTLLEFIEGDLEALSQDIDRTSDTVSTQTHIYIEQILNKLEKATNEAEAELDRLESILSDTSIKNGILLSFRDASESLSRSDELATLLYVDPKEHRVFNQSQDMAIMAQIGALSLPSSSMDILGPSTIKEQSTADIFETGRRYSIPNTLLPSTPGTSIAGLRLDRINHEDVADWWSKKLSVSAPIPDGAITTLCIDLTNSQEVNSIEVHPSLSSNMTLESVFCINGERKFEAIGEELSVKADQPIRLIFRKMQLSKLYLVLRQKTYTVSSDGQSYHYQFGLNKITVGNLSYQNKGVFISKTLSLPKISKMSLSEELLDSLGGGASVNQLPLIEYWIHLREYDADGNPTMYQLLPILPETHSFFRERLIMNSSGETNLMFKTSDDDMAVTRDGTALLVNEDYSIDVGDFQTKITINSARTESRDYIAYYNPAFLSPTSPTVFTDSTQVLNYDYEKNLIYSRPLGSRAVRTDINLIVIMRGPEECLATKTIDKLVLRVG